MKETGYYLLSLLILVLSIRSCADTPKEMALPACEIWVNGADILDGAHTFSEGETEIYISSLDKLDIISSFSGDSSAYLLQIRLFNAGEDRVDISSLQLWDVKGRHTGRRPYWHFIQVSGKKGHGLELDLSQSSLILLPGEELLLPELMLFLPSL